MGRPKGSKNKPKLQLSQQVVANGSKPTPAQRMQTMRRQVALCVADGMSETAIAEIVGISIDQLRAVFGRELAYGREIVRADELMRLDAASGNGNVPASKAILAAAGGAEKPDGDRDGRGNAADNGASNSLALRILNGGKADVA